MSTNPYAPPLANVLNVPEPEGSSARFFAVAPWKLVLMCLVTLGLYQLYWFYQHWVLVRRYDRSTILPVPRAIFGLFYCYSLFSRIRKEGELLGLSEPPAAGLLATVWIIASIAWRLPGALALLGVVSWFTMIPIQTYANRINAKEAPDSDRNARLTWLNWVGLVLGGAFFGFVVVGLLVGEAPPAP
jgi:hypothetical protein